MYSETEIRLLEKENIVRYNNKLYATTIRFNRIYFYDYFQKKISTDDCSLFNLCIQSKKISIFDFNV